MFSINPKGPVTRIGFTPATGESANTIIEKKEVSSNMIAGSVIILFMVSEWFDGEIIELVPKICHSGILDFSLTIPLNSVKCSPLAANTPEN